MGYSVHPDWGPQRRQLALADAVRQPFPPRGMGALPNRVDEVAKVSQNVAAERTYGASLRRDGLPNPDPKREAVPVISDAIDHVVLAPRDIEPIRVGFYRPEDVRDEDGQIVGAVFDQMNRAIRINTFNAFPGVSGLHELGHVFYVDAVAPLLSMFPDLLDDLRQAMEGTTLIAVLRTLRPMASGDDLKEIGYLLDENEMFARAFAQTIIMRNQFDLLKGHLALAQRQQRHTGYWGADDFATVGEEMAGLIRRIGWAK